MGKEYACNLQLNNEPVKKEPSNPLAKFTVNNARYDAELVLRELLAQIVIIEKVIENNLYEFELLDKWALLNEEYLDDDGEPIALDYHYYSKKALLNFLENFPKNDKLYLRNTYKGFWMNVEKISRSNVSDRKKIDRLRNLCCSIRNATIDLINLGDLFDYTLGGAYGQELIKQQKARPEFVSIENLVEPDFDDEDSEDD